LSDARVAASSAISSHQQQDKPQANSAAHCWQTFGTEIIERQLLTEKPVADCRRPGV
jgi:hypothetical protein